MEIKNGKVVKMTRKEFKEKIDALIKEYTDSSNEEYADIDKVYTIINTDEFLIEYSIYRQNR